MKRHHNFDFGFDQKPDWVKAAEEEELARLHARTVSSGLMADVLRDVAETGAECLRELQKAA